jgi:hypothetical protein
MVNFEPQAQCSNSIYPVLFMNKVKSHLHKGNFMLNQIKFPVLILENPIFFLNQPTHGSKVQIQQTLGSSFVQIWICEIRITIHAVSITGSKL